jgi:hypothetical protein
VNGTERVRRGRTLPPVLRRMLLTVGFGAGAWLLAALLGSPAWADEAHPNTPNGSGESGVIALLPVSSDSGNQNDQNATGDRESRQTANSGLLGLSIPGIPLSEPASAPPPARVTHSDAPKKAPHVQRQNAKKRATIAKTMLAKTRVAKAAGTAATDLATDGPATVGTSPQPAVKPRQPGLLGGLVGSTLGLVGNTVGGVLHGVDGTVGVVGNTVGATVGLVGNTVGGVLGTVGTVTDTVLAPVGLGGNPRHSLLPDLGALLPGLGKTTTPAGNPVAATPAPQPLAPTAQLPATAPGSAVRTTSDSVENADSTKTFTAVQVAHDPAGTKAAHSGSGSGGGQLPPAAPSAPVAPSAGIGTPHDHGNGGRNALATMGSSGDTTQLRLIGTSRGHNDGDVGQDAALPTTSPD